jgi:1,4-dihydroxy-2-naphthoyl-CoA hydrolase
MNTTPPAALVALMPFAAALGVQLDAASSEEVRGRMAYRADLCTAGDVLHGGALMAFADSVGAVCAYLNLPAGASTTTIESKTNFFRAVSSGTVHAHTRPVHVGGRTIVVQTELSGDAGHLVAQVTQTQLVRKAADDG